MRCGLRAYKNAQPMLQSDSAYGLPLAAQSSSVRSTKSPQCLKFTCLVPEGTRGLRKIVFGLLLNK
ncbi:unnamed protein product [Ixodes persulcatus]